MHKKAKAFLEYGTYVLILVLVLFIVPEYILEKDGIKGTSMENNFHDGEHILVEKVSRYFGGPDRFDVIVFTKKHGVQERTYIKRVIGLPGETVQIVDGQILIDGAVLKENYGKEMITDEEAGLAAEPMALGEDEYFVLGDNRNNSIDSTDYKVGAVKKEELDGVVFFRIAPWSAFGTVK